MLQNFFLPYGGFFYGWRMIAVGAVLRLVGGGVHFYGFTVFFLPLSRDLGLSRAATSLAFSLARAEGAVESPIAGYLIDRFGPRPVMWAGVAMTGIGYMLLSAVQSYLAFMIVYLGVISLSFGAGFMHSPMVLANTWFIRRRSFAMTLISAAVGAGGTIVTPLLSLAIHTWGWRHAALLAGLCVLFIGLPLASFVRRSPESMGLLPDGGPPRRGDDRVSTAAEPSAPAEFTASEAMRTPAFWLMTLGNMFRVAALSALMVHFIPIMVWKGLSEPRSAVLLASMAFLAIPAHLLMGWMGDFVDKSRLMTAAMLTSAGAFLLLIFGEGEWSLWFFVIAVTSIEAIFPVSWAAVGDFFGRRHFGAVRGNMSFFYMWGSVVTPVIAGAIYDRTQSYALLLWGMVLFCLAAAVFYFSVVKPAPMRKDPN